MPEKNVPIVKQKKLGPDQLYEGRKISAEMARDKENSSQKFTVRSGRPL